MEKNMVEGSTHMPMETIMMESGLTT